MNSPLYNPTKPIRVLGAIYHICRNLSQSHVLATTRHPGTAVYIYKHSMYSQFLRLDNY